jgi:hypothetical protein
MSRQSSSGSLELGPRIIGTCGLYIKLEFEVAPTPAGFGMKTTMPLLWRPS